MIHGGDVYNNKVNIDYSVSVNPLGVPKEVLDAMQEALSKCERYPEIDSMDLRKKCANKYGISVDNVYFGNGSSELFMGIANTINAKKVLIPVPSFFGYEHAFLNEKFETSFYQMKEENDYSLDEDFIGFISDDYDCLVIANPNNPTGKLIDKKLLTNILDKCKKLNIRVILDECFTEFTGENNSFAERINEYPNLCIIRSFTKIFAIPSIRLGYMISSDTEFIKDVIRHLPEWNVSGIAQVVGDKCFDLDEYVKKSLEYIENEKKYLSDSLNALGIKVLDSDCNYFLIKAGKSLYDSLLERKILIRDCSNFRGMKEGFFRLAVKKHEENEAFIKCLKEIG